MSDERPRPCFRSVRQERPLGALVFIVPLRAPTLIP